MAEPGRRALHVQGADARERVAVERAEELPARVSDERGVPRGDLGRVTERLGLDAPELLRVLAAEGSDAQVGGRGRGLVGVPNEPDPVVVAVESAGGEGVGEVRGLRPGRDRDHEALRAERAEARFGAVHDRETRRLGDAQSDHAVVHEHVERGRVHEQRRAEALAAESRGSGHGLGGGAVRRLDRRELGRLGGADELEVGRAHFRVSPATAAGAPAAGNAPPRSSASSTG